MRKASARRIFRWAADPAQLLVNRTYAVGLSALLANIGVETRRLRTLTRIKRVDDVLQLLVPVWLR